MIQSTETMLKKARTLYWENETLVLIDQTKLPVDVIYERQKTIEQVWDSIKQLKVRGAPAIGVAAAYGVLYAIKGKCDLSRPKFLTALEKGAEYLNSSRPTAVNLSWALNRMVMKAQSTKTDDMYALYQVLEAEAMKIHEEDIAISYGIGQAGLELIKAGSGVLTHCNAGSLATSELGTATAPMYLAHNAGRKFRVYADETRPLLQGARLTSWELQQAGIDVTLICDNMAAFMMSKGFIDLVITGCDRVAANGDAANKIGTMGVAILAKHFNIPFYIACPSSTIDFATKTGADIVIEERKEDEVTFFGVRRTGPEGIKVRNPAFDVTPKELIKGFITEKGIVLPPFEVNLAKLFNVAKIGEVAE